MLRSWIAAMLALAVFSSASDARDRYRAAPSPACVETVTRPCYVQSPVDDKEARRISRGRYISDQLGFGGVADKPVSRRR